MTKKKIYYWSPFLSPIATCKAVIESAGSLMKFSSEYESYILNFFGEFSKFDQKIKNNKIKIINYYKFNITKYLPYQGKLKSRFSFLLLFFLGFNPLRKIIKNNNPEYLIIHLITSLPLILLIFNRFNTKFILRISGYPKMSFLRRILWKLAFRKIYLITCPTISTMNYIKKLNIVDEKKVKLLYEPILNIKEINIKKRKNIELKNYFLSVGRLTKQKNFLFLCKAFKKIIEKDKNVKLAIAGNGEDKKKLEKFINKNNLNKNIILLGYIENIYPYFKHSRGFILSSLWEDPGFVLMEASLCRTPILSSNASPGPIELIQDFNNGIIFENNNINNFIKKFEIFKDYENVHILKLNNLKKCKNFTIFNHYTKLNKLLSGST